jgi:hypothetical protein
VRGKAKTGVEFEPPTVNARSTTARDHGAVLISHRWESPISSIILQDAIEFGQLLIDERNVFGSGVYVVTHTLFMRRNFAGGEHLASFA